MILHSPSSPHATAGLKEEHSTSAVARGPLNAALAFLADLPSEDLKVVKEYLNARLSVDLLARLPQEIALGVLSHLDGRELLRCQGVSRAWRELADDQVLWRQLVHNSGQQYLPSLSISALRRLQPTSTLEIDEGVDVVGPVQIANTDRRPSATGYPGIETLRSLAGALPSLSSSPSSNSRFDPLRPGSKAVCPIPSYFVSSTGALAEPNFKHLHLVSRIISHRMVSHAHTPTRTSLTSFASLSQGGLESHTSSVYCVSLVDGMAVTGGKDCNVRIWDLTEGRERVVSVLEGGHQGSVLTVCVLPFASSPSPSSSSSTNGDGSDLGLPETEPEGFRVLSGGSDGVLCLWEVRKTEAWGDVVWSSKLVKSVKAHTESLFGIKADLKIIVTCSKDRHIKTFDTTTLEFLLEINAHKGAINAICYHSDQDLIISASGDRSMRLWDAKTGELYNTLPRQSRGIASIDFDGRYIVSGSSDSKVREIDLLNPKDGYGSEYGTRSSSTEGETSVCTCTAAGLVGHSELVRAIQYTPDHVVSASYDRTLKIWSRKDRRVVKEFRGQQKILGLACSKDKILIVGFDAQIILLRFGPDLDTTFLR